jgi:hypothetical protein
MQYMMFVVADPDHTTDDDEAAPDIETWLDDVTSSGVRKIGDRLRPCQDATTVRVRSGELLITDGPFAETKEWIAGFDLIECDDLDTAIEVAAAHPMAYAGRIELRPFWPLGED